MTAFINKSSLSLVILFGLYWLFLRKEKLFVFNRFFLLAAIVFSLALPFIVIPVNFRITPGISEIVKTGNLTSPGVGMTDNLTIQGDTQVAELRDEGSHLTFSAVLIFIYAFGVALFLFRFLRNIIRISLKKKSGERIRTDRCQVVLTDDKNGPCCFFGTIFLNREDYHQGRIGAELIDHELEHSRQGHTADIILVELLKIFYWFNPVGFLYERAIRINHEYLADSGVISGKHDIKAYAEKLLNFVSGQNEMSLTSGSESSFIRERLLMMAKAAPGKISLHFRKFAVILTAVTFTLIMSCRQSVSPDDHATANPDVSNLGTAVQDTNMTWKCQAKIIENNIQGKNTKITLRGNAIVTLPGKNKTTNIIRADSAIIYTGRKALFAYKGTVAVKNENGIVQPDSVSFSEMQFNMASYNFEAKNVHANIKLDNSADTIEKPELFPIGEGCYAGVVKAYGAFNYSEKHRDTTGKPGSFHYGIDIDAKYGTDVKATAGGKVIFASWNDNGFGRMVEIDHGGSYRSIYAHLSDYMVKEGERVKKGQLIGHVGSSGLSTGPHLHFQINVNGVAVNPIHFLK